MLSIHIHETKIVRWHLINIWHSTLHHTMLLSGFHKKQRTSLLLMANVAASLPMFGLLLASFRVIGEFVEFAIRASKVLPGIAARPLLAQWSYQFDSRLHQLLARLMNIFDLETTDDGIRRKMLVGPIRAQDL